MAKKEELSPVLKSLKDDMLLIGTFIRDFSKHVMEDEISEYPVYVAFKEASPVGKPFLNKDEHHLNWNYNASILEEFVEKKVVKREKVEEFMNTFGDPMEKACILVIVEKEAGFVFVPFEGLSH